MIEALVMPPMAARARVGKQKIFDTFLKQL